MYVSKTNLLPLPLVHVDFHYYYCLTMLCRTFAPTTYDDSDRMPQEPQTVIGVVSPAHAKPSAVVESMPQFVSSESERAT